MPNLVCAACPEGPYFLRGPERPAACGSSIRRRRGVMPAVLRAGTISKTFLRGNNALFCCGVPWQAKRRGRLSSMAWPPVGFCPVPEDVRNAHRRCSGSSPLCILRGTLPHEPMEMLPTLLGPTLAHVCCCGGSPRRCHLLLWLALFNCGGSPHNCNFWLGGWMGGDRPADEIESGFLPQGDHISPM